MHLGRLRSALYTYCFARRMRGTFILRIEDTDQEREVLGAIEQIYKDLRAAGIIPDEGPETGGDYGPYIQSQRRAIYAEHARDLIERGGAYYCFCAKERLDQSRREAEARGETYKYDKHCLAILRGEAEARARAGEPHVVRQNVPLIGTASFDDVLYGHVSVDCSTLDDNVLIKADGLPTYNFANVIDDHLMRITHVTRGNEYVSSAPKYNLIYQSFGWQPPVYVHLSQIMATPTRKLSKRMGDPTVNDLRDQGYLLDAIINYVALMGWSPRSEREFFTLDELCEAFDLEGLNKSPALFDIVKLTWFNAEYMRRLPRDEYLRMAGPWFEKTLGAGRFDMRRLADLTQGRTEALDRIPEMVGFLADMPEYDLALYSHKKMKTDPAVALNALKLIKPVLEAVVDWTEEALHGAIMPAVEKSGLKTGQMLWPLRVALSGKASTPGGAVEIAYLLGKNESIIRVDRAIEKLMCII
jgi:glutamyl-tRNA synthetase